ncbi:hypothetical protein ANN_24659 [Periplaneta americana]|uniref:Per a allergen n=1 Tax=Periplaneta americana TaxID=6978 RepID=A0ABQ8S455_PERAM|nr:hypothetical protein ANN_24659 [Periplaneta americana]
MAGLCEGGNEPTGSLKARIEPFSLLVRQACIDFEQTNIDTYLNFLVLYQFGIRPPLETTLDYGKSRNTLASYNREEVPTSLLGIKPDL